MSKNLETISVFNTVKNHEIELQIDSEHRPYWNGRRLLFVEEIKKSPGYLIIIFVVALTSVSSLIISYQAYTMESAQLEIQRRLEQSYSQQVSEYNQTMEQHRRQSEKYEELLNKKLEKSKID